MQINSDLLNVQEAADYLRISTYKVKQLYRQRKLGYVKIGIKVFFTLNLLRDLLENCRVYSCPSIEDSRNEGII